MAKVHQAALNKVLVLNEICRFIAGLGSGSQTLVRGQIDKLMNQNVALMQLGNLPAD